MNIKIFLIILNYFIVNIKKAPALYGFLHIQSSRGTPKNDMKYKMRVGSRLNIVGIGYHGLAFAVKLYDYS